MLLKMDRFNIRTNTILIADMYVNLLFLANIWIIYAKRLKEI